MILLYNTLLYRIKHGYVLYNTLLYRIHIVMYYITHYYIE